MNPWTSSALLGLTSHLVFKTYEPTLTTYVVLNAILLIGAAGVGATTTEAPALAVVIQAAVAVLVFNATLATSITAYRLSPWHPLAQYPGPILGKITKLWMVYWTATGKRHLLLARLHEKYGPWVRVGPNELSVNSASAVRPIYKNLFRAPSYQAAPQEGDCLVTTLSREEHDMRLVGWTKAFSSEGLHQFRALTKIRTTQLIDIIRERSGQGPLDLFHWVSLWALDIAGDVGVSGGFETMKDGRDVEGWIETLHVGLVFVSVFGNIPWFRDVFEVLPQPDPILSFNRFAEKKAKEAREKGSGAASRDILGVIQNETTLTPAEARADASFILLAASDTVSEGTVAFIRFIAGDVEIQQKLRDEMQAAFRDGNEQDDTMLRLPYLDACIQETLRMIPPVAAGPPRYSADKSYHIDGNYIPPRTTVSYPNYAGHRDPRHFVNPNKFIPERWLASSTEAFSPHNVEAFLPFCYGPGVCIGKPVALFNMKLIATELLLNFHLSISPTSDTTKFDDSWREFGIWKHDSLMIDIIPV